MQIGAVAAQAYRPYVYKPNAVNTDSLNKINGIGKDLLASKTDFSGITQENNRNENPLKMGETSNFADILMSQMQMGRMNADRLINPVNTADNSSQAANGAMKDVQAVAADNNNNARMQMAAQAYQNNMLAFA